MASNNRAEDRQQVLEDLFETQDPLFVHRFELPNDIARAVFAAAKENERTIPGQIRMALRVWGSSK
ncbi:MAG: hypothetical protein QNL17_08855 [Synechococcus sp. ChSW.bin.154]